MLIRFSTVAGERGSPDTWRDPRGFALKFYTAEGNYDIVGNNTPVFFIRDPMKFQHFIRSQKRRADNNLRDHDMQWDFWTLSPESAHQVTWLMGDRGIPRTWRHMNGYGSPHLHVDQRRRREVLGEVPLQDRPGHRVLHPGRGRPDGRRSTPTTTSATCTSTIERGEFPSWTLKMQIMPFEEAKTYRFNPFDLTKVWPHGDYPLIEVGRMTLDRNVTDYHTEIEQAAFEPNNLVPGIGPIAGQDAAGPRVLLRRRAPRPARRQLQADPGEPPHVPRSTATPRTARCGSTTSSRPGVRAELLRRPGGRHRRATDDGGTWHADGEMVRTAYTLHAEDDDWGQAGTLVREVLDDAARDRLVDNIVGHLLNGVSEPVLLRAFEYWRNVDKDLGDRIEAGVRAKQDETDPKAAEQANPARESAQAKA